MSRTIRVFRVAALVAVGWTFAAIGDPAASAQYGWDGQRKISYQRSNDLFYNYYVGPGPSGVPAEMYVAPLPVPANVGHTYVTYQPFMPHEFMYKHHRSTYNYHPGAGWTRTKVRYHTAGTMLQHWHWSLHKRGPAVTPAKPMY
jgi:hypothetical protein